MNPWTPIYVIAGAWAIFAIVWAIALDALELARWARRAHREASIVDRWAGEVDGTRLWQVPPPPSTLGRGRYAAAVAVLIALWLAAAFLR